MRWLCAKGRGYRLNGTPTGTAVTRSCRMRGIWKHRPLTEGRRRMPDRFASCELAVQDWRRHASARKAQTPRHARRRPRGLVHPIHPLLPTRPFPPPHQLHPLHRPLQPTRLHNMRMRPPPPLPPQPLRQRRELLRPRQQLRSRGIALALELVGFALQVVAEEEDGLDVRARDLDGEQGAVFAALGPDGVATDRGAGV